MAEKVNVVVKWGGTEYPVTDLEGSDTVLDLKERIKQQTGVLPARQKLLGLKMKGGEWEGGMLVGFVGDGFAALVLLGFPGKPPDDDIQLSLLKIKPGTKIMMMGTREENLEEFLKPPEDAGDDVINDFDIEEDEVLVENREENLAKIARRVKDYEVKILNPSRPGKKLLVLDVDYTIFDHRSVGQNALELMRPYLHEFLTQSYEHYDIVIWSATSMKWIEAKMKELGMSDHPNYKIMFLLDSSAMITVHTPKYGVVECKPLAVIWGKFDEYSSKNTIMFDDIRRNFLMNPQNGLRVRPFREAHLNRHKDRELKRLGRYLRDIATLEDFGQLNHRHWERYRPRKHRKRSSDNEDEENEEDRSRHQTQEGSASEK